jgi:hypothetical protein
MEEQGYTIIANIGDDHPISPAATPNKTTCCRTRSTAQTNAKMRT